MNYRASLLVFLGETLSLRRLSGIVLIVAGGWILSRSAREARTLGLGVLEEALKESRRPTRLLRPGILFPILAGIAYATSDVVAKSALIHLNHPPLGALISLVTALSLWGLAALSLGPIRRQLTVGKDVGWLLLSGALAGVAILSLFSALKVGDVTVVSPITASQPLIVFLLSRLLLRKMEDLRLSIVVAEIGIVIGALLVSL